ncbi:MAG: arginase family protein [Anaerolineales bacterium]|nr:arginase family protein [Anaerolineales bacterium]
METRKITIFEAPSNLGLMPPAPGKEPGVKCLSQALLAAGLGARLGAATAGKIPPPPYSPRIDRRAGVRNAEAIRRYTFDLAAALEDALRHGQFPLVLGGDCSILLGCMLASRRLGHFGLMFLDGHTDFGTPETSLTGGAAGMDLALACGYGPQGLTSYEGLTPLVAEKDVVVFGHRDISDPAAYIWQEVFDTDILLIDLDAIRTIGLDKAVAQALDRLESRRLDGFWIHLDADVLDEAVMPAVDSPQPGGFSYPELAGVLAALLASDLAVGLDITIFDPTLDPDGSVAAAFVEALASGFGA